MERESSGARTVVVLAMTLAGIEMSGADGIEIEYPESVRMEQVDVFHGVEVVDPYRWLEEDVRESERVREWVEAQNRVTFDYLEAIPERARIQDRLKELWNYERRGIPTEKGGRYFYTANDGLQNQSVLYVMDGWGEEPRVLIDPNGWSEDGTIALAGISLSEDGEYVAYGVAEAGSDWQTRRVMRVKDGHVLDEELKWIKFSSVSWTPDSLGFFYSRYEAPKEGATFQDLNLNQKLYYHRLGTPQSEDAVVFYRPDQPEWGYSGEVTDDGKYLVVTAWKGTDDVYRVFYRDLDKPYAMPVHLIGEFDYDYTFLGNRGSHFFFRTNLDAARGRVVRVKVDTEELKVEEVIPERESTLRGASMVGNSIIASYLKDARSEVRIYTPAGEFLRQVDLPGLGTVSGFGGSRMDTETFYSFESFAEPDSIYRYDLQTGKSELWWRADVPIDTDQFEVRQEFYRSKDGTRIPMFLVHRKGIELDGNHPTVLYGYGGFNISITPRFSMRWLSWLELGGVVAVANLRGGGEYGKAWHEAGKKLSKQNVFDDFIAAAEWLIESEYTRSEKLAIMGGSNGGLLVGAAMTQRPELFGACLPAVGVMDMLRFHLFTAGRFWVDDYGSVDDREQFEVLRAYSPYHNLEKGIEYPATLVTTADTDDRVVPGHSFKFAAALQHAQGGDEPVLIRIETRAGHGGGKPVEKAIEELADQWAFLVENLGMRSGGEE